MFNPVDLIDHPDLDRMSDIWEKLLQRSHWEGECLVWDGPCSGNGRGGGYGRIALGGTTMAVHRVSYTLHFGIIPHKKQIDHTCKNRRCFNPKHLEMVTHKQNQKRRIT